MSGDFICSFCGINYYHNDVFTCAKCDELCCYCCGDMEEYICYDCIPKPKKPDLVDYISLLEDAHNKLKLLKQTFVQPLMNTCGTCFYVAYVGPNAEADDCNRDDYDGGDPVCVDDWWEEGKCIKWKVSELVSWDKEPKPEEKEYVSVRDINCMKCRKEDHCEVTLEYTESGKVNGANVTRLPDGWESRPYGTAGGTAPYCPECLACDTCKGTGWCVHKVERCGQCEHYDPDAFGKGRCVIDFKDVSPNDGADCPNASGIPYSCPECLEK